MQRIASAYLVRPRAWWFNKVPLSVALMLLLLDGGALDSNAVSALVLVVLTVCAVGNYGYALNDLYDVDEDLRVGRVNAAVEIGRQRTAWLAAGSAVIAETLAAGAAGWQGALLTIAELSLPLAYSAPPLRIKERRWLGIVADALAAHVYPAALALMAVTRFGAARPSWLIITCVLAWSSAVGIRGILSHQLHTADRDRSAGLNTVVHGLGRATIERFNIFILLPIEVASFIGVVAGSRAGPLLWACGGFYLICEAFRTFDGRFVVTAFRPEGQRYLPFVDESFYKAWGPIVIALDAARIDLKFIAIVPLYALLFRPHMQHEWRKLRGIKHALLTRERAG
jgi:4-hydroxybenzoate polyprenyltransferase